MSSTSAFFEIKMSIFSIFGKNLRNCIFNDDFENVYDNEAAATIFQLYCSSGGFCFHEDVRPEFRKFWIYYNVINFILVNVSCLFYLFNVSTEDYLSWLLPLLVLAGLLGKVCVYYWIHSTKDLFTKLIGAIDENNTIKEKYALFCTTYSKKREIKIIKMLCCMLVICTLAYNLESYVKHEKYFINFYPMYFPFSTSFPIRTAIRFIQMATLIPEIILFASFPMLIFTITIDIYNRFEVLSVFLRETSYSVRVKIDEITNLETAMAEERIPNTLAKIREINIRKEMALDEMIRKTIVVIERHQELYS